jgi:hypothetical protein
MVLEELKSDLYGKGLSHATVKHVLVLVRMVWNKAGSLGTVEGGKPYQED